MALIGKIIAMTGVATIQNDKGDKRALHPGDQIQTGDSIQTTAGVDVDVQLANGRVIHIGADQMVAFTPELAEVFAPTEADSAVNVATIDTVIQAIQDGRDINQVLEETAAGGAGGSDGSHNALYLDRINQTLNSFGFPDAANGVDNLLLANSVAPEPIAFVGDITSDTEVESTSLTHVVTLQNVSNAAQTYAFSITGVTATAGTDFTSGLTFSNGVTFTASTTDPFTGTITVPANTKTFSVTVPTVDDNVYEGNETYTINVGGVTATGTITDEADRPTITAVEPGAVGVDDDAVPEGTPLVYNVTLSNSATVPLTYSFVLNSGGTASADDIGSPTFSNGVTYDAATGLITVPAGVTSFSVTVPTINNNVYEGNETVPLTIGGVTGTGTITDEADRPPYVTKVEAGSDRIDPATGARVGSTVVEGDVTDPLLYTVTLSNASSTDTTVTLSLTNGTGIVGTDTTTPVRVSFDGGTTFTAVIGSTVTVPAGTTKFIVSVPTFDDAITEPNETILFTASTASNTPANIPASVAGTIVDNDVTIVTKVEAGSDRIDPATGARVGSTVVEGDVTDPLLYTVTLSNASSTDTTVTLSLTNGTGIVGTDTTTPVRVSFDGGTTFTAVIGSTVTVPAGTTKFIVSVPTFDDAITEPNETILFTASTASNTPANIPAPVAGTIVDNDVTIVTKVEAGSDRIDPATGARVGSTVVEGDVTDPLLYTVTLSNASSTDTTVTLSLTNGTGIVGTDTTTPVRVSFDGGTTFTAVIGSTVTVPAGTTKFIVSVPTFDDAITEPNETILFTASTASNTPANIPASVAGTIVDNDVTIVTKVEAGSDRIDPATGARVGSTVVEGDVTDPLLYTVTLSNASSTDTTVTLSLTNGTGIVGTDTTTPVRVSFDGGTTFTAVIGSTVTVPAGTTKFIVSVPTFDDAITEPNETILFTASTASNTPANIPAPVAGTIVDNDVTPNPQVHATGFIGEYYGYNDVAVAGNRIHLDDTSVGNLNSIADVTAIINARNAAAGFGDVVGSNTPTSAGVADVTFNVTSIDYGNIFSGASGDLGRNIAQSQTAGVGDLASSSNLSIFLKGDAASADVLTGSAINPNGVVGVDTGLGKTTDAIIRMTGAVLVDRGNYDFRVTADDGFRFKVNGDTLLEYDGNQSPTVRTFNNLSIDGGLVPMELLYWEQGGDAVLKIEFKLSSSDTWLSLDSTNVTMFSTAEAAQFGSLLPTQEIYQDTTDGLYKVRDIGLQSGTDADNILTGTANADSIEGLGGNDTINGGNGDDGLFGNNGNDTLNGGDGNDILDGGAGFDAMNGGLGDDIYKVDSAGELSGIVDDGGTDTIELMENFGAVTLDVKFENAIIGFDTGGVLTGNDSANRLIGGAGNDTINGGLGDDRITGVKGSDTLTGGSGNDVFEWKLGDHVGVGVPEDHITDFTYTGNGNGTQESAALRTDSIDLRDLLVGENSTQVDIYGTPDVGNLLNFLQFTTDGTSTVINVSTSGGFAGGFSSGAVDQKIVLDNVDLFNATGAGSDQTLLLQKILANGTLIVD